MANEMIFWGERGEYGPFRSQTDGWPYAGEVVRHYRHKKNMSADTLAQHYGQAIHAPITARWIFKMERQNKVPTDITRRRILAEILEIPACLLGLASLNSVLHHPPTSSVSSLLTSTPIDLERHQKNAQLFWKLHYAQTAHDALPDLKEAIGSLESLLQTAKGELCRNVSEILNSYYRLAATLERDRGNFEQAYFFANESVRCAKIMGDDPSVRQLIAASLYTRGVVSLAWGAFGNQIKQGKVLLSTEKLDAALIDFERALPQASPSLKGILYCEMARAKALGRSTPTDETITLKLIEQAEPFVDGQSHDDFYTQIMLHGDIQGLDTRRLLLGRAKIFLALQRPEKAIDELDDLELLKSGGMHTRRRAWTHIFYAQAAFDLGEYGMATEQAMSAFYECQQVQATAHLGRINDLYSKLHLSPYRKHTEVKQLGRLLAPIFPSQP
jgi:tetratricopeptide (TPR) repeat protein